MVVTKLHMSDQIITCAIQIPESGEQFICSAIYTHNIAIERISSWRDLRGTQASYAYLNLPWVLTGEYNVKLASNEHSRAMDYRSDQVGMTHFQEVITDCGLLDLPYVGTLFTWWNKREEDPIGKKLDRALVDGEWLKRYPQSYANFYAGGVSDHARCLVRLTGQLDESRKPFRFFNYLADHEEFLPTVKGVWDTTPQLYHSRSALTCFHQKLKQLKFHLNALNKSKYGDLLIRTKQAYEDLCECQNKALLDPSLATFARATEASERWHKLAKIEEKLF